MAKAVARRLPPDLRTGAEAGREWIESTTAAVLAHPDVVTLSAPLSAEVPTAFRRRDGLPGHERHGTPRHTTRQTLAREGAILDALVRGRHAGVAVTPARAVDRAARTHRLGADQTVALHRICEGGERLACVVGPAGAGKTRMIRAARDAWTANGIAVRGLAVSAVAAGVLAEEAGIPADTVAKFLHDTRRADNPSSGLGRDEVVVVDEVAMLATADLAALVEAVEAADAKLVLVGDHRQLGAVEAGGLFRLLVADSRAAELHQVRRFTHPWEAAATLRLRNGDESVLDDYDTHGRIAGGAWEDMLDEAFAHWQAARVADESIVVMAADHATVDALALRARAERVAAGEVEPEGLAVGAQTVGRGDEIVTTRNDRRLVTTGGLWVRNGDRWHVDSRRDDGALVVSHLDGHGRVVLPADYVAEHVALAYAVTIHKAEGVTVDNAVLLADSATSSEHLYVGMSRGRHDNRVCVVTDAATTGHGHRPPPTPVEVLVAVMRRSSAELSATETLRDELDRGEDRETLRRLHEQVVAYIETGAGPDRRPDLRRLQQLRADLPVMRQIVAGHQREVARLDNEIARVRRRLTDEREHLDALSRGRRFRRPDRHAIDETQHRIHSQQRYLDKLEKDRARSTADLERRCRRLGQAEQDVARIPDVERDIQRRTAWTLSHPAELEWEAELAARLAGRSTAADSPEPTRGLTSEDDLDAASQPIDLRTIDLSPKQPVTGIEQRLREALGIAPPGEPVDVPLPPLPGRGIDGPDLGLGL